VDISLCSSVTFENHDDNHKTASNVKFCREFKKSRLLPSTRSANERQLTRFQTYGSLNIPTTTQTQG